MNEQKNIQQEIAPLDISEKEIMSQPAEKKENKAAAFFKLSSTQKITYFAILIAISVVLKRFSITIGATKISFLYLPVYLAGALMGPFAGFAVGGIGDILGTLLKGEPLNFIITFGNALMGAIMGLIFCFKKGNPNLKLIIGAVISLFICSFGINTIGLNVSLTISGAKGYLTIDRWWSTLILPTFSPLPRIALQPIVVTINLMLVIPAYTALKKLNRQK